MWHRGLAVVASVPGPGAIDRPSDTRPGLAVRGRGAVLEDGGHVWAVDECGPLLTILVGVRELKRVHGGALGEQRHQYKRQGARVPGRPRESSGFHCTQSLQRSELLS